MRDQIVFADGTAFDYLGSTKVHTHGREWLAMRLVCSLAAAKAKFVDGAVYFHEWDSLTMDAEGKEGLETIRQELSEYSVPGDLVDSRDGNITVYMGKPTELEKAELVLEVADRMAQAAKAVAKGERPAETLADMAAAYDDVNKKHRPSAPPGNPGNPGKPKP